MQSRALVGASEQWGRLRQFFVQQQTDEAGRTAVLLEILLINFALLLVLDVLINIGHTPVVPLLFTILAILLCGVGFVAAYKKRARLLLIFTVAMGTWAVFTFLDFLLVSSGKTSVGDELLSRHSFPLSLFILDLLITILSFLFKMGTTYVGWKLYRRITDPEWIEQQLSNEMQRFDDNSPSPSSAYAPLYALHDYDDVSESEDDDDPEDQNDRARHPELAPPRFGYAMPATIPRQE
ncbi:hypothetical protein QOT17_004075 [Balamuthia mandrillaris]